MSPNPEKASRGLRSELEIRKTDCIHCISAQKKKEHTLKIPERKTVSMRLKKKKVKGRLS